MALETPSRPPPFMANAILNFHFDFLKPSLKQFAPPFIDGDTDEEEDAVKRDDRRDRRSHTLHCRPSFEGELLFPACGSL